MIDCVKGFLQVYEDTTGKVAIVKRISYHFCEAYKNMISWIMISKTNFIRKQYFIFTEKVSYIIGYALLFHIIYLYWIRSIINFHSHFFYLKFSATCGDYLIIWPIFWKFCFLFPAFFHVFLLVFYSYIDRL